MKHKIGMALAALMMTSGLGIAGATQASARECQYETASCKWEATDKLCAINRDTINRLYPYTKTWDLPQPYKSRFNSCSKYGWKSRG